MASSFPGMSRQPFQRVYPGPCKPAREHRGREGVVRGGVGGGKREKLDRLGAIYGAWGAMPDSLLGLVCRV